MVKRTFNSNVIDSNVVDTEVLEEAIWDMRRDLGITSRFPDPAWAEAREAAASVTFDHLPDRRDIPFITIDPEGSRDLDQALHIEREGEGYLVRYAISAVSLFVTPGGPLDQEVQRRGMTVYLPDRSIPLHPGPLSADAASLLPDVDRPAYLWYHHLDSSGELQKTWVELAQIRSRAQLTYTEVQAAYDGGAALPAEVPQDMPELLATVGQLREHIEINRGGVSLDLPEQRIERSEAGYKLSFRTLTGIEGWNSQISLLTGIAAADMMAQANIGILRTLPEALKRDVNRMRNVARALELEWPSDMDYPDFVRSLSSEDPSSLAFLNEATTLFRGADYVALPLAEETDKNGRPTNIRQAAVASTYAHVTAPLRRLVDRYGLEVCRCLCASEEVPVWVRDMLPQLPKIMADTGRDAGRVESRAISAAEALTLVGREGEIFEGVIIETLARKNDDSAERGVVLIREPAIEAVVTGESLTAGDTVRIQIDHVEPKQAQVRFSLVEGA